MEFASQQMQMQMHWPRVSGTCAASTARTRSSITFFPGSCICYNAKDPWPLANRRLEPAIGCCGGALSRHPGAASRFTAPMRPPWPPVVSSLPWMVCRGVAPKDWKLHHRPLLDAAACRRRLAWPWEKRIEIQDGDSPGLCFF
ncbi:hypothetical protein CFAM422_011406 [Trichoderma lentiforme]|uniref:Uncharacterized protein n=1 Tax=Trichoderma lentiforme TaxID=1567552 RepID=A0A9P5C8P7_9HYPO|nr:hypothetical protein CFAM422_011406 [Trichoderma lentiforme]